MKREKLLQASVVIVTLIAATMFVVTLVQSVLYAPNGEVSVDLPQAPMSTTTAGLPARLSIPSLGIDASVQQVGITATGNMAAPHGFSDVGWYKYGTVPGNLGSAVIDGHVDNGLALAGVFKHLQNIQVGDDIYVTDAKGNRLHFVVSRIELYDYKKFPSELVFSRSDKAYLNLITCDGAWVGSEKTYDKRLVVFSTYQSV